VLLAGLAGCGEGGPPVYPVAATVRLAGADVAVLAGSGVEAVREDDPAVRAFGEIGPDGSVRFESLHAGRLRAGAPAGRYAARIVVTDEVSEQRAKAVKAVARRFQDARTSGLVFEVPPAGEVVLAVSPK
jgi:predicted small lipoprotein YifL